MKRGIPRFPVLVATSLTFEEAEEVAQAGADDFLIVPVDPTALLRKVPHWLARYGHADALHRPDRHSPIVRAAQRDHDPCPKSNQIAPVASWHRGTIEMRKPTLAGSQSSRVALRQSRQLVAVGD